jgi:SAM-dependent methyltransferase
MTTNARPATTPDYQALGKLYDDVFYDRQLADILASARIFTTYLRQHIQPRSVLDVGCGRGPWLKAWHEAGSQELFGLDGDWNRPEQMIDPTIQFRAIDLNRPFSVPGQVDLAMSLEVAEHLLPASGAPFVTCLTEASDLVLFSAAFSNQGGRNHINEQPHSYWASLFADRGYAAFDLLRPVFWGDARVCYWYRQNTFLYVKRQSPAMQRLLAKGLTPLADSGFMDCVHPELFRMKVEGQIGPRAHLADLLPSVARAVRRRLRR